MKIYWSLESIPELSGLTEEERKKIWRSCRWKIFQHPPVYLALVIFGICPIIGHWLGLTLSSLWSLEAIPSMVITLLGFGIGIGVGGFIYGQISTIYIRPYMRKKIAKIHTSKIL
jgi:hypothetical protein